MPASRACRLRMRRMSAWCAGRQDTSRRNQDQVRRRPLVTHWRFRSAQRRLAAMYSLAGKLGLAILLAALSLGGRTAHAQSAPVQYWLPSSSFGFGGPGSLGLDGNDAPGSRSNFPSGWFVGNTRSDFGLSGFKPAAAFGNFGLVAREGMQFGYHFKNAPLLVYSGFDTLKYNTGLGTSASGAFAAFDRSATAPGAFS